MVASSNRQRPWKPFRTVLMNKPRRDPRPRLTARRVGDHELPVQTQVAVVEPRQRPEPRGDQNFLAGEIGERSRARRRRRSGTMAASWFRAGRRASATGPRRGTCGRDRVAAGDGRSRTTAGKAAGRARCPDGREARARDRATNRRPARLGLSHPRAVHPPSRPSSR